MHCNPLYQLKAVHRLLKKNKWHGNKINLFVRKKNKWHDIKNFVYDNLRDIPI